MFQSVNLWSYTLVKSFNFCHLILKQSTYFYHSTQSAIYNSQAHWSRPFVWLLATDGDWSWGHRAPLSSDLFDTHTNTRENKRRVLVKHFTSSFQHFQLGFLIQGSEKELKLWGIFEFQGNILPSLWTEPRTHISIAFQLTQTWRQNSWKRLGTRERWSLQSASLCLVHRYVKSRKSEFRNKYVLA